MRDRLARVGIRSVWDLALLIAFIPGAASWALIVLIQPAGLGSHATIYTEAAAAMLGGRDPWVVGPPAAVFAGPPTMLVPYIPFVILPGDVVRVAWFALDLVLAAWTLRRLRMPTYWLAFPPLFSAIILGHVELLVLAGIVIGGAASGVVALIKPYAVFPMIADRRWRALLVAVAAAAVSLPLLPWGRFVAEYGHISSTLARQNTGDSVFGDPILMVVAVAALIVLGPKRALWLCMPLLWPYAQAIYKTMTIPMLTPVVAFFWALPFAGATLGGILAMASLVLIDRRRALPAWLKQGIEPVAAQADGADLQAPRLLPQPTPA